MPADSTEAQRGTADRCAVVIGVDRTGGLIPLESAAAGARQVAELFKNNNYDVALLTDENGAVVTASQIEQAITRFVKNRQTSGYRLLVVYFSGHGYRKNQGDLWLLSGAPGNPNEAVSLLECIDLAQDSGVQTVVLISDACRSLAQNIRAERVRGTVVFPNDPPPPGQRTKVDRLMASRVGAESFEVQINKQRPKESVFTHCFLKAYASPDPGMVHRIQLDGEELSVVPNRKLEKFLVREVEDVLASVNITINQEPVIEVLSDDDVYMARTVSPRPSHPPPAIDDAIVGRDIHSTIDPATGRQDNRTAAETGRLLLDAALNAPEPGMMAFSARTYAMRGSSLARQVSANLEQGSKGAAALAFGHFESGQGFTVTGDRIADVAMAVPPAVGDARILERRAGDEVDAVRVTLDPAWYSASMLLTLSSGRGIPLAVLPGYIGHIVVRDGIVQTISYIPIEPGFGRDLRPWRWDFYLQNRERLERLRALAAAGLGRSTFRIGDRERASRLAEVIRDAKGVDPILGLLSTYAYLEAGNLAEMSSIRSFMSADLQAELFDVALLARTPKSPNPELTLAPFCPILTQGWNYLRTRRWRLPQGLSDAQDDLISGPWTMFSPVRAALIAKAIRQGHYGGRQ